MGSGEDWFRSVYDRYMPWLRMIAWNRGIPHDEIEDAVQETFFRYNRKYPNPKPDEETRVLLAAIMRNFCNDYYRETKRHPLEYLDVNQLEQDRVFDVRLGEDVLHLIIVRQDYENVLQALRSMREDWLIVFVLYIIQGRTIEEVSKLLGISADACRMRLARGRKYLKHAMEDPMQWPTEQVQRLLKPPDPSDDSEVPGSV